MRRRTVSRPWLALISITFAALLAPAGCGATSSTPEPGPGTGSGSAVCGDGVCAGDERTTCVADCDPTSCGNGACDPGDKTACANDCPVARCGDGVCQASESSSTCPGDCHVCGDGVCQADESVSSCETDCAGTLVVQNQSSKTVIHLYVAPCGATSWGNDQLGKYIISPGGTFTLHGIPPGCYLFHADASDGSFWERTSGTNIAAGGTFTWTLLNLAAIAGPPPVGPAKDAAAGAIDAATMIP